MPKNTQRNSTLFSSTAAIAAALAVASSPIAVQVAYATDQHSSGESHSTGHTDQGHETETDHGQKGGKGGKGRASGEAGTRGHGSLQDIFRAIAAEEDEGDDTSDRPDWAGAGGGPNEKPSLTGGDKRGDLYGDMYVILRDDDGDPVLTDEGWVQPIDAEGNLIPLDEEGAPLDPTLAIEVDLGRLNVGRAPTDVLDTRASEVVTLLNSADKISVDAAGRLVIVNYTYDDEGNIVGAVVKTIDAPLENLALYVALMTDGTIPGVSDLPGEEFDFLVDGAFTEEDLAAATSFLAAASDKFEEVSLDAVAYMNAILDINTTTEGTVTYSSMDYSTFSYDRSDTYENVFVQVLILQPDGSWLPEPVNIYEAVFDSSDYTSADGFDGFAQAVDDAREVINYIHEYAIPEEPEIEITE